LFFKLRSAIVESQQALDDLHLIRRVLEMTQRRVDPQMFHAIIWGALVMVWFPLMNWFELRGDGRAQLYTSLLALALGMTVSATLGYRAARGPRLKSANTHLAAQVAAVVATFVIAGLILSLAIPCLVPGGERFIPHVWGFLYALKLLVLGIFYSREFFWCGLFVFAGGVCALAWVPYAGFILGAAMGLGCIVPGVIAERRVARLRGESLGQELRDEEV
jgi:hypothetical protein